MCKPAPCCTVSSTLLPAYVATRDTDERLAILAEATTGHESAAFLRQVETLCKDEEGLLLARAFLQDQEKEEEVDSLSDDEWNPIVGVEESKGDDDAQLAAALFHLEEVAATVYSCLSATRGVPRRRLDAALAAASCPPSVGASEYVDQAALFDALVAAHDATALDQAAVDAMTVYALTEKYSSHNWWQEPAESATPQVRCNVAPRRAAELRDGRLLGELFFNVTPNRRDRQQDANGTCASPIPPNPGGGPCLVGIDFDALDDLLGLP